MIEEILGRSGILGVMILYGALQGWGLSVVFALRRVGDTVANRLLAVLILLITLHLTEQYLALSGLIRYAPWLDATTWPLVFLIGPVTYHYVRRLTEPSFRITPRSLLHAIPALYIALSHIPWYRAPAEVKAGWHEMILNRQTPDLSVTVLFNVGLSIALEAGYAILAVRCLRGREADARRRTADNAFLQHLASVRRVTLGFAVFAGWYLALYVGLLTFGEYGMTLDLVWLAGVSLFLHAQGYAAITRPETFAHDVAVLGEAVSILEDANGAASPASATRYAKSALTPERASAVASRFVALMESDRLYLDGSLKLPDVARRLGVTVHTLSQVVNQELGRSFLDVVNAYRIEEAKRLLADPERDHLTVLAIGFDAGFNNKTSFNNAFKRALGVPPSTYRRKSRGAGSDRPAATPRREPVYRDH